ncbi:MAG TPA: hypothetical protein VF988_10760 [Verrucomicrobiae bacterium]
MSPTFCKHLRTKKLFTGATVAEAFADKEGDDVTPCHFWCNLTQSVVGPDDRAVHKNSCQEGRSCFED